MKAVRKEIEERVFYGATEAITWPQAVVAWDGWVQRQDKRPGTINRYLVSLLQLRHWLDDKDIQRIDHDLIRQIVRDRSKLGVTNATIPKARLSSARASPTCLASFTARCGAARNAIGNVREGGADG